MKVLIADKGYDANYMLEAGEKVGAKVVIPPRKNRKIQREYDKELYKKRNIIERMFNKMKHFRRVATRYDKLDVSYLAFVFIVALSLWFI
jgi:transposase